MPKKPQIAATWDKIALEYGGYGRKLWPPVNDFLRDSNAPILDIGCGNAQYYATRQKKGRAVGDVDGGRPVAGGRGRRRRVVGIDISFETCKLAKKHLRPIQADATALPIKSNSFSRVLSVATIHHLPSKTDRENFFAEIKRILKPRGSTLITATYRYQKKYFPTNLIKKNRFIKWGSAKRYYHLFSKRELARLASKHFKNFKIWTADSGSHANLFLLLQPNHQSPRKQ